MITITLPVHSVTEAFAYEIKPRSAGMFCWRAAGFCFTFNFPRFVLQLICISTGSFFLFWTSAHETSQVTYVTMVPRVGNETLRPLGVATGNALSVTRSEDTYEKTPPVGRRQPMTSLPAYHNISAAGRIHHQLLRLKLASEAWLKAQGTQCLVPHSGNHGYIRNLRRSPSWELELRPLGVATGNVIPTSPC